MNFELLLSAIVCGIFAYLGALETPWALGVTGGFYTLGRPLVAGLVVGLAFGNVQAGVLCGLAVQAVFIANLSTGGATNSEITYAAYGGIGLAMATTQDPAIAVALSILIGNTFGLIFYNTRMALYSYWNRKIDDAVEKNNTRAIMLNHMVYPQITTFLFRALPVTLAIYYGQGLVESILNNVPQVVTDSISVLGNVLPALGIAMLMNIVIKNNFDFIYFFAGFALLAFAGLDMIPLVIIAALVAYLVYLTSAKPNDKSEIVADEVDIEVFEDDDLF